MTRAVALAILVVSVVAFPAAASPVVVGDAGADPVATPIAVADGKVVWLRARARYGEPRDVVAAAPGGPQEVVLRGPEVRGPASEQLGFLASDGEAVAATLTDFVRYESGVSVGSSGVWAGLPQPELQPVPGIGRGEFASDIAVAGGRLLVLVVRDDERSRPRLVERDLATGAQQERLLSREVDGMIAAGGYVALLSQRGDPDVTRITVRDRRSWRARTSVALRGDVFEATPALRPDGLLAIVHGIDRVRLSIARPGARRLRTIGAVRPSRYRLAFVRGAPAVVERHRGRSRIVRVAPDGRRQPLTPGYQRIAAVAAGPGLLAWRSGRNVLAVPTG